MTRRTVTIASLSAALALGGMAGAVTAQDEVGPADDPAPPNAVSGTIETLTNEDGRTVYYLRVGDALMELSFGPAWFGDLAALFELPEAGTEVEVGGSLRNGVPNGNASDVAKDEAVVDPVLKVKTIDGERRAQGKPAWAGGPKVQGEAHPGYEGWSRGQANKARRQPDNAQGKATKPQKVGKPGKAPGKAK